MRGVKKCEVGGEKVQRVMQATTFQLKLKIVCIFSCPEGRWVLWGRVSRRVEGREAPLQFHNFLYLVCRLLFASFPGCCELWNKLKSL